jgi:hypothetical protein
MPHFGWRWLLAFSSIPSFILLLFYVMTPESPRFLCMKGRTIEAVEVLEKMARLNNVQLPSGRLVSDKNIELDEVSGSSESTTLLSATEELDENINKDEGSDFGGIKSIGRLLSPNLIRATLLLWIAFFGNAFAYYGIVLLTSKLSDGNRVCSKEEVESVNSNKSSLYKNVFISSFAGWSSPCISLNDNYILAMHLVVLMTDAPFFFLKQRFQGPLSPPWSWTDLVVGFPWRRCSSLAVFSYSH